jgi:hypothetical protein
MDKLKQNTVVCSLTFDMGATENGMTNGNRSATEGKIMAMPMMDNDRPGRSVDETYAENQRGLERSTRTNEITGRFINHSCNRFRA